MTSAICFTCKVQYRNVPQGILALRKEFNIAVRCPKCNGKVKVNE